MSDLTGPALSLALSLGAVVLLATLVFRGWLTLAEAAFTHENEAEVRRRAGAGETAAQLVAEVLDSGAYVGASLIAANGMLLLLATVTTVLLSATDLPPGGRAGVHLGVIASLALAELAAWLYGGLFAERLAARWAPACLRLARLLGPLNTVLSRLLQTLGVRPLTAPGHPLSYVTAADIQAAADLSEEGGEVEPEVGRMLDEVMELTETTVREIMVPRVEIFGVPAEAGLAEMMEAAIDSGYSRLPVYSGDLDNLRGVLLVSDLLDQLAAGAETITAGELARPALLTPESRPISDLLREMRERATHMAIVIGEDGGTEGLVTIEDILEELVGEIEDEHDTPEEDVENLAPGELLTDGRVRLSEVEEALGVSLPETEAETVAGLTSWLLGRIPREGETVTFGGVSFRVEEREGQQIRRVRVIRTEEAD